MNVLIIANHTSTELGPLTRDSCLCLLPITGKPLIEHTLESVARLSPDSTTIVASRGLNALRDFIGSGERWGLVIDVVSSRPNESIAKLHSNNERLFSDDTLIIECNRVRNFSYQDFISAIESSEKNSNSYTVQLDGADAGLHYLRKPNSSSGSALKLEIISLEGATSYPLNTPLDYHTINMLIAAGQVPTITTRGRERSLGLTTGFMTRIHPRSIKAGRVHAGNNCRVHPSCSLSGSVVLNNGVVVDRNTSIENSVILDRTFVGENLEIKNAILFGDLLIRVDTGAVVEVTDRFLTAHLGESLYDAHFANITNQLAGLALLIISLPLWPLCFILALLRSPRQPLISKQFVGNKFVKHSTNSNDQKPGEKRFFKTFEFNVKHGLLRKLPLVISIATGHVRLVGVSLCSPAELEERTEGWQTVRDSAPAGALGPSQLFLSEDASLDEKILTDAIFAQQASKTNSLYILLQAIRTMVGLSPEPDTELQY